MGWMSPKQLNEDPKKWLGIPHEFHESLLKLQEKWFPGFAQKLKDLNVHCLECEGRDPFPVIIKDGMRTEVCTGYVGTPDKPDELLFHTRPIENKEEEARLMAGR